MFKTLNDKEFKFVIAGGGTAGYLTALYIRFKYPLSDITLIENKEIGILGAGEGTTPLFIDFLDMLNIPTSDIVKNCSGTIKHNITFTNWNGDGKNFKHSFGIINEGKNLLDIGSYQPRHLPVPLIGQEVIAKDLDYDVFSFNATIASQNKVLFTKKPDFSEKTKKTNPILDYNMHGMFALHFDASKLAEYLKTVALKRTIKVVDDEIIKFNNDANNYIKSVSLKTKNDINCDFIFDCTGFNRLIIGKHYKDKWVSYKEHLPMKKALAFQMPVNKKLPLPPYTDAIAMKYGWVWKIPLHTRYGCGYVFDSDFITTEQAMEEVKEKFGNNITFGKTFSFDPGTYTNPWTKNCIALGLATGFMEPLEATSIWLLIISLLKFTLTSVGASDRNETYIKIYNDLISNNNYEVLNFIYFHYMTKRNDTEFWRNFTKNNKAPNIIQKLLDNQKNSLILFGEKLNNEMFVYNSYIQCGAGLQFFDKKAAKTNIENLFSSEIDKISFDNTKNKFFEDSKTIGVQCVNHTEFLNHLYIN